MYAQITQDRSPMALLVVVWLSILAVFLPTTAMAMPVYNLDGGLLVGIDNLEVNGTAYNVEFRDGAFETVFNLADPFAITGANASAATQALALSLLDVPAGNFDSNPLLTRGCVADNCRLLVPTVFEFGFVSALFFRNAALDVDDEVNGGDFAPSYDTTGLATTLTVWSVANVANVPEPETFGLLALGLLLMRRRYAK